MKNDPFLKNIITNEEKWIFYKYVLSKRQWIDKDDSIQQSFAVSMVRLPRYHSFWVFKTKSETEYRFILATTAKWTWKSKKTPRTCHYEKTLCFLITQSPFHTGKKKMIRLVCFNPSIIFTRRFILWFPVFLISTKCSEWQKTFLKKIKWEYLWKPDEFYWKGIKNQFYEGRMIIKNNGEYSINRN